MRAVLYAPPSRSSRGKSPLEPETVQSSLSSPGTSARSSSETVSSSRLRHPGRAPSVAEIHIGIAFGRHPRERSRRRSPLRLQLLGPARPRGRRPWCGSCRVSILDDLARIGADGSEVAFRIVSAKRLPVVETEDAWFHHSYLGFIYVIYGSSGNAAPGSRAVIWVSGSLAADRAPLPYGRGGVKTSWPPKPLWRRRPVAERKAEYGRHHCVWAPPHRHSAAPFGQARRLTLRVQPHRRARDPGPCRPGWPDREALPVSPREREVLGCAPIRSFASPPLPPLAPGATVLLSKAPSAPRGRPGTGVRGSKRRGVLKPPRRRGVPAARASAAPSCGTAARGPAGPARVDAPHGRALGRPYGRITLRRPSRFCIGSCNLRGQPHVLLADGDGSARCASTTSPPTEVRPSCWR